MSVQSADIGMGTGTLGDYSDGFLVQSVSADGGDRRIALDAFVSTKVGRGAVCAIPQRRGRDYLDPGAVLRSGIMTVEA